MLKLFSVLLLTISSLTLRAQVKLLTLSELEQKIAQGKDTTYVVNFWATWCTPCIEELPNFEKLQQENLKKPLKVILMSLDFKSKLKSAVVPFVVKRQIKSAVYVVNEPDQQAFIEKVDSNWSGALPATLIINTNKKVRAFYAKAFSYKELAKTIETLTN